MMKLIFALTLGFTAISALAGTEMDSLEADIEAFQQEQHITPNHVINYADKNGKLAHAVLDSSRVNKIYSELLAENNQLDSINKLMKIYRPVESKYDIAFMRTPGKYDAEYLDMTDFMFRLYLLSQRPIGLIKISEVKDDKAMAKLYSVQKLANTVPANVLKSLSQDISLNKFRPEFMPLAEKRFETLSEMQNSVTATNTIFSKNSTEDDYAKARIFLAYDTNFDGYALQMKENEHLIKSQKLIKESKIDEGVAELQVLVDEYPLSIMGNMALGETYKWQAQLPQYSKFQTMIAGLSETYLKKANMLIQSIKNGTECSSPDDICKVININEETMLLRQQSYNKTKQSLIANNGIPFDVITGTDAQGKSKQFYFDVSLLFSSERTKARSTRATVPDKFVSIAANDQSAYVFARSCLSSISEENFSAVVNNTAAPSTNIAVIAGDTSDPTLVFANGRAYCVRMSEKLHPILPIEAFGKTVSFTGLREEENALWSDISYQIAANGYATTLIIDETGNGYQISFSVPSDQPTKLNYQIKNLKKGKFTETTFSSIYHIVGNVIISSNNPSKETSKLIFTN